MAAEDGADSAAAAVHRVATAAVSEASAEAISAEAVRAEAGRRLLMVDSSWFMAEGLVAVRWVVLVKNVKKGYFTC